MGKSSSSSKKIKHSRDSSKLRSVKKNKSKRNKSKKIRRIKDYSDESESSGSDSSLYSSSEDDDYRRKKKRRFKVSKKRSRKRHSSSESESDDDDDDDDDDTRLLKKKKRSKRKEEHVRKTKKKKISSKKKRKRDSSSSSTSSESNSSRVNRSEDDSDSDGKRRSRVRGRRVSKVKASPRIIRDESEGDSELDECWQRGDKVIVEENPRSLKSIVVVSNTYDNDERVDVHDDLYLTHEGNIDSGNREFGYNVESDEIDGETTIPYSRTHAADYGYETVGYDHFGENNKSEISKSCHIDNSMKEDDLEAILKKRALENLKRFRGVTQRSGIERKELSSVSEGEPLQIESKKVEESQYHCLMEQRLCDPAGSKDLEASEKLIQVSNAKNTGTVLVNFASQQDQHSDGTTKVEASSGINSCTTKRKLVRPVLGKESLNLPSRREAVGSQDSELESINDSTIGMNCRETENGGENIEPVNLSSHTDSETLEEFKGDSQSEQKTIDETKDESQYEQKTMTVMRGGEMVQVSYKVYIPKKTSSLGRRKLKR